MLLVIIGIIATYLVQHIITRVAGSLLQIISVIFILLFSYFIYKKSTASFRALEAGSVITGTSLSSIWLFRIVENNFLDPQEWDFLCFFMHGHVAARGLNFYKPENYSTVLETLILPYTPDNEFITQTINIGFLYFPPNIFNFLFLGYFDFNSAHLVWVVLNAVCLSLCIYLAWQLFLRESGIVGFIFTLGLFLTLPGTHTAIGFEHNTFIFMLPMLLAWKYREKPYYGIWLAIGFCLKPMLVILFVYPLLRREWKPLLYSICSLVIISLATVSVLGTETFLTYFIDNPVSRGVPGTFYSEWINQSLLATIIRLTNFDFVGSSPVFHPIFLITSGIISLSSFYFALKLKKKDSNLAFALIVITTLLLYPGSIDSYSPLIIPLIGLIIYYTNSGDLDLRVTFPIILFVYLIMLVNPFISHLTVWLFLIFIALFKTGNIYPGKISLIRFSTN